MLSKALTGTVTLLLWLVSVVVAIVEIILVRELIMQLYTFLLKLGGAVLDTHGTEFWAGVTLQNFVVLFLAICVLIFVVATGEYHARHLGTRQSWTLFAWTFTIQVSIFGITFLS